MSVLLFSLAKVNSRGCAVCFQGWVSGRVGGWVGELTSVAVRSNSVLLKNKTKDGLMFFAAVPRQGKIVGCSVSLFRFFCILFFMSCHRKNLH